MVQHSVEDTPTMQQIESNNFPILPTESTPQQHPSPESPSPDLNPLTAVARTGRKRERSPENEIDINNDGVSDGVNKSNNKNKKQRLSRSVSRFSRSVRNPYEIVPGEGLRDSEQKKKAMKLAKKAFRKRNKEARRGEGDRVIPNLKPKHIYVGKRGNGKTQRR